MSGRLPVGDYESEDAMSEPAKGKWAWVPEQTNADRLREMADWFDDPTESPSIAVKLPGLKPLPPGFLLRRIAEALEAGQAEEGR